LLPSPSLLFRLLLRRKRKHRPAAKAAAMAPALTPTVVGVERVVTVPEAVVPALPTPTAARAIPTWVGVEEGGRKVGAVVARGEALRTLERVVEGVTKLDTVALEDGVPPPPTSWP
jgi:hypothetical protein